MDAIGSALKNKMKGIHIVISPQGHDELHADGVGQIGHKPDSGKDPHLDHDQDMDHDDMDDKAPMVHDADGNGNFNELAMLKGLTSDSPTGRSSMGLGERAKDKMKERMASINKHKQNGDAKY